MFIVQVDLDTLIDSLSKIPLKSKENGIIPQLSNDSQTFIGKYKVENLYIIIFIILWFLLRFLHAITYKFSIIDLK